MADELDTSQIKNWRSIITLIVFVLANINVLWPYHIPIYIPRVVWNVWLDIISTLRIIPPRQTRTHYGFRRLYFPMNFMTAPLIGALFLLAILAIGRQEVHDGTIGANNISPIDIMTFFLSLAYIAISIDASGLIRFLAFKVLQKGGKVGHRLFFYLYAFFFGLASFIGNDPIILSGTAFLAYMTRVSSNIVHPRAWIHTQFAVANTASAILVSSNPTNLVLAGAFKIKFVVYTANIIVPVIVTGIVLFPFLLYIVFADPSLIPFSITMHELSDAQKQKKPINPNIPNARAIEEVESDDVEEQNKMSLEEIMNPFLDKGGASFGAIIMATTLITLLALNASSQTSHEHPVFWVTLPAAFVMFCWDVSFGWLHRDETRKIAREGREEIRQNRERRASVMAMPEPEPQEDTAVYDLAFTQSPEPEKEDPIDAAGANGHSPSPATIGAEDELTPKLDPNEAAAQGSLSPPASAPQVPEIGDKTHMKSPQHELTGSTLAPVDEKLEDGRPSTSAMSSLYEKQEPDEKSDIDKLELPNGDASNSPYGLLGTEPNGEIGQKSVTIADPAADVESQSFQAGSGKQTLESLIKDGYRWSQETFPTVTAVVTHLPFALIPFAFSMFVLVQGLVTKGWVPVFAYGWDHWVNKTGTVGAIGGMGFLSVCLCNFSGTNIGTTILLSRVIQAWVVIHDRSGIPITDRTFWATVYAMALGVNYGAYSTVFSASLAGLLWRDILRRKHIRVRSLEFARVNLPIIAVAMTVGCVVLVGEVYIMRHNTPYHPN